MAKNVKKVRVNFIAMHIKDFCDICDGRTLEDGTDVNEVLDEIELLVSRSVAKAPVGGGFNAKGNAMRHRCPTCGAVLVMPAFNNSYVGDYICRNCRQVILWGAGCTALNESDSEPE